MSAVPTSTTATVARTSSIYLQWTNACAVLVELEAEMRRDEEWARDVLAGLVSVIERDRVCMTGADYVVRMCWLVFECWHLARWPFGTIP